MTSGRARTLVAAFSLWLAWGAASCSLGDDATSLPQSLEPFGESRVAEVLGLDSSSDDALAAAQLQRVAHVEAFGGCLRRKGFEGFPLVFGEPPPAVVERQPDELEWVRQFGFGVFTLSLDNFEVVQGAGAEGELQAYVSMLSPEASERLRLEYDGDDTSSCMAQADNAVSELPVVVAMSTFAEALQEINERAEADQRHVELMRSYVACMGDGGYPNVGSPAEAAAMVDQQFSQWLASVVFNGDSDESADFESQLSEASRSSLSDQREWEVALAVRSYECEVPIREDLVRVLAEVEQSWIAENQERLSG